MVVIKIIDQPDDDFQRRWQWWKEQENYYRIFPPSQNCGKNYPGIPRYLIRSCIHPSVRSIARWICSRTRITGTKIHSNPSVHSSNIQLLSSTGCWTRITSCSQCSVVGPAVLGSSPPGAQQLAQCFATSFWKLDLLFKLYMQTEIIWALIWFGSVGHHWSLVSVEVTEAQTEGKKWEEEDFFRRKKIGCLAVWKALIMNLVCHVMFQMMFSILCQSFAS